MIKLKINIEFISINNMFENIKQFILEERWKYDFEITLKTSLQKDLSIFGDDASDILNKFSHKFNVDISEFNFDDYFKVETSWIDDFSDKKEIKELTIEDLIKSIEKGKLI